PAAANLIDSALLALASAAFVRLVRQLSADRRAQWLATFVILSHPGLNRFRTVLVRDFGLWAFGLLALGELIRFGGRRDAWTALSWTLLGMSTLVFRPEAAPLFVAGPLTMLVGPGPWRERVRLAVRLAAFPLALALGAAAWLRLHPVELMQLRHGTLYLFQPL